MIENPSPQIEAEESMKALNNLALTPELRTQVHASTDVTGFGLAGHIIDMLSDDIDCSIYLHQVPLITGVKELADMGLVPEGSYRNQTAYSFRPHI